MIDISMTVGRFSIFCIWPVRNSPTKTSLHYIIRDDVNPYRINGCNDPVSSRARQLNRDIAEVPRASDRNVVNVASSMGTAPLIKLGHCSGKRRASTRVVWTKRTLCGVVVGHRIGESRECGRLGIACIGAVSRRM